jgi:hypothetical protein
VQATTGLWLVMRVAHIDEVHHTRSMTSAVPPRLTKR